MFKVKYVPPTRDPDDPEPEADPYKGADEALQKEIGLVLARHFPKQVAMLFANRGTWTSHQRGIATLCLQALSGVGNVWILHIPVLQEGPNVLKQQVLQGAGELLERYRIERDRKSSMDAILQKIADTNPIGIENRPIPE